jgi:hypothetical protein
LYSNYLVGNIEGGSNGSIVNRNTFYIILGISFSSRGDESYKHGFTFTYNSQGVKFESTMKSIPNSSNPADFLFKSIRGYEADDTFVAISFILEIRLLIIQFL